MGQETAAAWRAALAVASAGYPASSLRAPRAGDPVQVGPYRIEAVLGQGGMGRVFLARDSRNESTAPVALKVLSQTGDATARARFSRELAAARRVEGAGTARVLDGDPSADPPWLATEYIDGPTLDQLVAARGPLSAQAAAGLAVGVAGALATIHAAGVVHRDLKPANIILAPDGPRVVDFGIARTADATTLSVTGWTLGTPGYMAPEQIADPRGVGPEVDVFALGAVLVFATTALSPYAGGDPATVIYRIVHGEPNLDGVPAQVRALVASCLARKPADRPRLEAIAASGLRIVDQFAQQAAVTAVVAGRLDETSLELVQFEVPPPPPPLEAEPTVVTQQPARYRRSAGPTADHLRTRRLRRGPLGALVALVVAAIAATSWFAVQALAHPSSSTASGTTTHTAGATASKSATTQSPTSRSAAFAGGTVVSGPGCASSQWAVFSVTSGSLERNVGGGDPACGSAADAFRKSGNSVESTSSAEWKFDFKRVVKCTLRIYIANADPSSGTATYKIVVGSAAQYFTVSQGASKGSFVAPAELANFTTAADGVIRLTLTDISAVAGDQNHVTASSVSAACQLA